MLSLRFQWDIKVKVVGGDETGRSRLGEILWKVHVKL